MSGLLERLFAVSELKGYKAEDYEDPHGRPQAWLN